MTSDRNTIARPAKRLQTALRGRMRLLLAGALIATLTWGGTSAVLNDQNTAASGRFSTDDVDIDLGIGLVVGGTPTTYTRDFEYTISNVKPGDTYHRTISIKNTGNRPMALSWTPVLTGELAPALGISYNPQPSDSVPVGGTTTLEVIATLPRTNITAPTGAGSFQHTSATLTITFTAEELQ